MKEGTAVCGEEGGQQGSVGSGEETQYQAAGENGLAQIQGCMLYDSIYMKF